MAEKRTRVGMPPEPDPVDEEYDDGLDVEEPEVDEFPIRPPLMPARKKLSHHFADAQSLAGRGYRPPVRD